MAEEKNGELLIQFIKAGIPIALSKTAAAPFERIKLLIQTQDELIKAGRLSKPYKGIPDCFYRTVKSEGFLSLWKGNRTGVIRYLSSLAVGLVFKPEKKDTDSKKDDDGYWKRFISFVYRWVSIASYLLLIHSMDYARVKLATDVKAEKGKWQFHGLVDVYRKTLKSDGLSGLYQGFGLSFASVVVNRAYHFGFFAFFKPRVPVNSLASFILDWGTPIATDLTLYPMDTVRKRMMVTSCEDFKYSGFEDAFKQMIAREGLLSLFKGIDVDILHVAVASAVFRRYGQWTVMLSDIWTLVELVIMALKKIRLM